MKPTPSLTRLRKTPRAFVDQVIRLDGRMALLTDLSLTGMRVQGLEAVDHLQPNDTAQLVWSLLPQMKALEFKLKCIWRSSDAVGLSFTNLDSKSRCLIRSLVRYHRNSN